MIYILAAGAGAFIMLIGVLFGALLNGFEKATASITAKKEAPK